jgi:hypothetical protein
VRLPLMIDTRVRGASIHRYRPSERKAGARDLAQQVMGVRLDRGDSRLVLLRKSVLQIGVPELVNGTRLS